MRLRIGKKRKKKEKPEGETRYFDYTLLFLIIFLLGFGLVMLYSVSSYTAQSEYGDSFYYFKRQLVFEAGGFVIMIAVAMIVSRVEKLYQFMQTRIGRDILYVVAVLACAAVLLFGTEAGGQKRWISIGGFSIQPSEFVKVLIILFLASYLSTHIKRLKYWRFQIVAVIFALPIVVMIMVTNLSTAIIVAGIVFLMIFVSSPKKTGWYVAILAVVVAAAAAALLLGSGYRSDRIAAWLNPEQYADDAYQTLQGLYAIGSGGLFGKGLGASMQKLGFVPESQNDMIFSIICEELGLFGAVCVILLFVLVLWRCLVIANNSPDRFGSLIAFGVMAHIALQVVLNIAVVTNTIPNTGITLPFISYGGSSVVALMIEMGLVLGVSGRIRLKEMEPVRTERSRTRMLQRSSAHRRQTW